ncbi:hypothetical protein C1I98_25145 [Spongiactinospora gelatinilytica]|uniref:XRE family transcriptional regulator n=1 Tax=Spongiactinospora gelatinilytica TaxID=2666298 RepID=A0A2W2FJV1_9ACTN|nr:hypothetical protein C1I98_25145 [Spongiactinospora gelatinilytica]
MTQTGLTGGEDFMERRRLMQDSAKLAVGAAAAPVLMALTDAWQASTKPLPGATVSESMIDDWENAADVHHRNFIVDPPEVVLAALAIDFADMAPHLRRSQPLSVTRALNHVAARHAHWIAGGWFFMGARREATRWWARVRELADTSGDNEMAATARSWEVNCRISDPRENLVELLTLAEDACRAGGERPSMALVRAIATQAQVLALMGRDTDAVTMIRKAEAVFERMPSAHTWRAVREEGNLHFFRSFVYTLTQRHNQAAEAQEWGERQSIPGEYRIRQVRLHRAAAVARHEPEEGISQALRILEDHSDARQNPLVNGSARLVLTTLPDKARALPAAQELRALTAVST